MDIHTDRGAWEQIEKGKIREISDLVDHFGGMELFCVALEAAINKLDERKYIQLLLSADDSKVLFYSFSLHDIRLFCDGYEYNNKYSK